MELAIAFEDEANVCVRAPLGDFFGSGCGNPRFKSLPCGMTEDGYYAYWPMPFRKLAVVTLRNDGAEPVRIESCKLGALMGPQPATAGYFHARFVDNPDIPKGEDYHILAAGGRGKYVGTNLTMQNPDGGIGFYLEGNETIYMDGEKWPSHWNGTGTEDYFDGAYYWNAPNKPNMARPYGGLTFLDFGIGRACAYRWQILDFVSFQKEIRVDIEHGDGGRMPAHYASVAYYYLDRPTCQPPLPALAARLLPTPLVALPEYRGCQTCGTPVLGGRPLVARKFHEPGQQVPKQRHGALRPGRVGDKVEVPLKLGGDEMFEVNLGLCAGPNYAALDVRLDGKPLGRADAYEPAFDPNVFHYLGRVRLGGGYRNLTLTLARPNDAPAGDTKALAVGLIAVHLEPMSPKINQWSIIGNWPCPDDTDWERAHEPEKTQDLSAEYALPDGGQARWREVQGDVVRPAKGNGLIVYGLSYVYSPDDRNVALFVWGGARVKLWVNDEVVYEQDRRSLLRPNDACDARLHKGWNKVLVKCGNWYDVEASVRIGDPDRKLKFARQPQ